MAIFWHSILEKCSLPIIDTQSPNTSDQECSLERGDLHLGETLIRATRVIARVLSQTAAQVAVQGVYQACVFFIRIYEPHLQDLVA